MIVILEVFYAGAEYTEGLSPILRALKPLGKERDTWQQFSHELVRRLRSRRYVSTLPPFMRRHRRWSYGFEWRTVRPVIKRMKELRPVKKESAKDVPLNSFGLKVGRLDSSFKVPYWKPLKYDLSGPVNSCSPLARCCTVYNVEVLSSLLSPHGLHLMMRCLSG